MHVEWRGQTIHVLFELCIRIGIFGFEGIGKCETEEWQALFQLPLQRVANLGEPVAMIGHHNQYRTIQKSVHSQRFEPIGDVIIGHADQIDRIVWQFAVKTERKLWLLVAIGTHNLSKSERYYLGIIWWIEI